MSTGIRKDTSFMTVSETADYLARQQSLGWVGSRSIHPRVSGGRTVHNKKNTAVARKKAA